MCKGNGPQSVEKSKEKKQQVFVTKEQTDLMKKGAQPLPGFHPEKQSLSQFQKELQDELVILHELETKKEIQPAQPVFRNQDASLNLQRRLTAGERSPIKAERKEAAKIKDKTYEKAQKAKDEEKKEKLSVTKNQIQDSLLLGLRQNELSVLHGMMAGASVRQDLTGRQRRKNEEKYAEVTDDKQSVQQQAEQDADNLVRNLHMDIILEVEPEIPEEIKKYNDAYYFAQKYAEKIRFNAQKEMATLKGQLKEEEIVQLRDEIKALESAQEPNEEVLAQKQGRLQELEKLQKEYKEHNRVNRQVETLVLMLKGFATNFGAMLVQKQREIQALELARDQIRQEGESAYHTRMIEYLERKIAQEKNFYKTNITDMDTCNGRIDTLKGSALMETQKKLTALRREMLKVQENKEDEKKVEDLEAMAYEIIQNFAYSEEPVQSIPKVIVKERAELQFKQRNASYHLQKQYQADEQSEDKAVRQKAAETIAEGEKKVWTADRVTQRVWMQTMANKEKLRAQEDTWLTLVRNRKKDEERVKKDAVQAELLKEKGEEVQIQPKVWEEIVEPKEKDKFLSAEEALANQIRESEKSVYNKYVDRKDATGTLRRKNEKKYRKTNPEKQEVKDAAAQDVENLVNNLRMDIIAEQNFSMEPELQQFADIYYFTRKHSEDAILNNDILRIRKETDLLRFQLEKNKDTPAEEIQKAEAELVKLKENKELIEKFSLATKTIILGAVEANQHIRMLRAMAKARQMIQEEGESMYHTEMLRQLDEKIAAAEKQYDGFYEDLRTLNHKEDAKNQAILRVCNGLIELKQKLNAPGLSDQQKEELEEQARQLIYNIQEKETASAK